jgi:hypothetical protein
MYDRIRSHADHIRDLAKGNLAFRRALHGGRLNDKREGRKIFYLASRLELEEAQKYFVLMAQVMGDMTRTMNRVSVMIESIQTNLEGSI